MLKYAFATAATALVVLAAFSHEPARSASARPEVMVVGVAHLAAKRDLHNSKWARDVFDPVMQSQIKAVIESLARFHPTKVMIEAQATNPVYVRRYGAYRRGAYALGTNEDDQYGYRLAKVSNLSTIYPIDSIGVYPFDYDGIKAAAARDDQQDLLKVADASFQPMIDRDDALQLQSKLREDLRYLNTPAALAMNRGWYLAIDRIGGPPPDDAGAKLASYWYARNAEIFANIVRNLKPGDRAVVFIGQGHAAMLRPMLQSVTFVTDVDPEPYL